MPNYTSEFAYILDPNYKAPTSEFAYLLDQQGNKGTQNNVEQSTQATQPQQKITLDEITKINRYGVSIYGESKVTYDQMNAKINADLQAGLIDTKQAYDIQQTFFKGNKKWAETLSPERKAKVLGKLADLEKRPTTYKANTWENQVRATINKPLTAIDNLITGKDSVPTPFLIARNKEMDSSTLLVQRAKIGLELNPLYFGKNN